LNESEFAMNFLIALLLVFHPASQRAAPQAPTRQLPPAPKPPTPIVAPNANGYVIGSQDQLKITVFDEPDLSTNYRVDTDGMITFPLIGRVPARGLTLNEFQDRLIARLSAGYIRNPQVRVEIDQYKSQSIFVIGEVRAPGKIVMTGTMSLIEALAMAGSPTSTASSELVVVHPKRPTAEGSPTLPGDDQDAETTRVNIKDLQVGKAGQNIVLQDGDTIFVPKAQTFYITGQVRNPGSYVLDPGMTVLQAVSLAGGLTDRGSDRGMKIIRITDSKRQELDVKETDAVLPNDTIQIRQKFF
jgi:polysaccharide biosynthesis/export protein